MRDDERDALFAMRDIWTSGGEAAAAAPRAWADLAAALPGEQRERALLAVAAQALDVAFRPAAPKTLQVRPPLPELPLPRLPEPLRPLLRAALRQAADAAGKRRVVALAAARGYVVHPFDWTPSAQESQAPAVYAPWVDWFAATAPAPASEPLSAETWAAFPPAARRLAFAELRAADPAAARTLLEAKAAGEPAEHRLALIETLAAKLSPEDAAYLESLAADRSAKVKALAASLLARLGQGGDEAEARELAEFIETSTKGVFRRTRVFSAKPLKSGAQLTQRGDLFSSCPLAALAAALGASEAELAEGWTFGADRIADAAIAAMAAETASDAAALRLAERAAEAGAPALYAMLLPRLPPGAGRRLAVLALAADALSLVASTPGLAPPDLPAADILRSPAYTAPRARLDAAKPEDRPAFAIEFSLFGFVADNAAARAVIADLTDLGVGPGDPALALLRLNAALGYQP